MKIGEVVMKYRAAILSGSAAILLVSVTGCFSQQKSNSGGAAKPGSVAHGTATTGTVTTWSGSHKAEVTDQAYGMPAYTIDVPNGWKFVGALLRPSGCHGPAVAASGLSYTTLSPDGISAYMLLPGVSWTGSSNGYNFMGPKCPSNINIDSAAGFLLNIALPNLHRDTKSVKVMPLEEKFQTVLNANSRQATAQLRQSGLQGRAFEDAAKIRVEYDLNGLAMEEQEFAVVECQQTQATIVMKGAYTRLICHTRGTSVIRASKGHLDEMIDHAPAFQQINQAWDQRVIHDMQANFQQYQAASNAQFQAMTQHYAELNQAMLDRGKAFQAQQQSSFEHAQQNDRNTVNAMHQGAVRTEQFSLDRQTVINPTTGQRIETSTQFSHNWMSTDGTTVVANDDPTFDPNGVINPVRQSFVELIPAS
jgi:hypothetical protein